MKLFISHAWQDKTVARLVAEAMGRLADVWVEVERLKKRVDREETGPVGICFG